jgi:hypothetical protein
MRFLVLMRLSAEDLTPEVSWDIFDFIFDFGVEVSD